jgi:hypothetical protein
LSRHLTSEHQHRNRDAAYTKSIQNRMMHLLRNAEAEQRGAAFS